MASSMCCKVALRPLLSGTRSTTLYGHRMSSAMVQHSKMADVHQPILSCPMSLMPGPPKDEKMGSIPDMIERNGGMADNLISQWGQIFAEYRQEFGPAVAVSIPPLGDVVLSSNPNDFIKLYRTEGLYPPGLVEQGWMFKNYCTMRGQHRTADLLTRGEAWQNVRRKLAADLMRPQASRGYLPHINQAVDLAVDAMGDHSTAMDSFVSRLAFDMFTAVCTGKLLETANPKKAHRDDLKFIDDAQSAFRYIGQMLEQQVVPDEHPSHPLWFKFVSAMDDASVRSQEIAMGTLADLESGGASGLQTNSYMANLFHRGELDKDEIVQLLMVLLQAGVDTTAAVTNWVLIELAKNQDVQTKLRAEVLAVAGHMGDITEEHLSKMKFMKACIRESHRMHPPFPMGTIRAAPEDLELSGFHIPKDTLVMTDTSSVQQDGHLMDNGDSFCPERWSAQAVSHRKGTDEEVVDHALLRDPFGMGARSCLGQRVAKLEIQVAVAKILRRWELKLEPSQSWRVVNAPFAKAEPFPNFQCHDVH